MADAWTRSLSIVASVVESMNQTRTIRSCLIHDLKLVTDHGGVGIVV